MNKPCIRNLLSDVMYRGDTQHIKAYSDTHEFFIHQDNDKL